MLRKTDTKNIINQVTTAVKDWKQIAIELGIAQREYSLFEGRLGTKKL